MNKIFLVGNLTKAPTKQVVKDDCTVVRFVLAVNRVYGDRQTSDYFPVVVWRGLADTCAKYLKKGSKVCLIGNLQTNSYEAKDGSKRYSIEVVADEIQFLSGAGKDIEGETDEKRTDN